MAYISNQTLLKDIEDYTPNENLLKSRNTFTDYLDVLNRLYHFRDNISGLEVDSILEFKGKKYFFTDDEIRKIIRELNKKRF